MAVQRVCQPGCDRQTVNLGASANGEYLRYEVEGRPSALFDLVDENNNVLLTSTDPPTAAGTYVRQWPKAGEAPALGNHVHTLGMQFIPAVSYRYAVSHCASDGTVIAVLKDCTYTREDQTQSMFENLTINVF